MSLMEKALHPPAMPHPKKTKLWDLSEKYLFEKVPGYTGAPI